MECWFVEGKLQAVSWVLTHVVAHHAGLVCIFLRASSFDENMVRRHGPSVVGLTVFPRGMQQLAVLAV